MKELRQKRISEIVRTREVTTQDDLIRFLAEEGFKVTQATISRDIRDLQLVKSLNDDGSFQYVLPTDSSLDSNRLYNRVLSHSVKSVSHANNLVVIKTYPGVAQSVAAAIDTWNDDGILGCVAGDDTILVIANEEETAVSFSKKIMDSSNG